MRTESRNANPWPSQRRCHCRPLQNFALYFLVSRPGRIIDGGLVLWRVYSGAERERSMAGLHLQKQLFWIRRYEERSLRCESRLKAFCNCMNVLQDNTSYHLYYCSCVVPCWFFCSMYQEPSCRLFNSTPAYIQVRHTLSLIGAPQQCSVHPTH